MDFKKFASTLRSGPSLEYKCVNSFGASFLEYRLVPLTQEQIVQTFLWQKSKTDILLPDHPLITNDEKTLLVEIKENQDLAQPKSIHLALSENSNFIGTTGFHLINWSEKSAKSYFLIDPIKSQDPRSFGRITSIVLNLLMKTAFTHFDINKISIETNALNMVQVHTIEASGFKREAEFKDYAQLNGRNVSMIYASCSKEDYLRVFPNP